MKSNLSKYSTRFRDLDPAAADRAQASLERRLEGFRLSLDLTNILPWIKGPDVLDFPVGTGRFYPNLLGRYNVFGYDIAGEYIRRAKIQNPEIADNFWECSFEDIRKNRLFDSIVTLRTLNNIDDTEVAIRHAASILKPAARWIFNYPPSGARYHDLREMLSRHGLRVIREKQYDFHAGKVRDSILSQRIYGYYVRLIEVGLVPYVVFRVVDCIFASRGTRLFVCEKSTS